jgi:hypothetical protein
MSTGRDFADVAPLTVNVPIRDGLITLADLRDLCEATDDLPETYCAQILPTELSVRL